MAYTHAWTDNVPLGSEAAANIDDFMRRARLDIHERMNDVVVDWTADPVVPKTPGSGATRIIPAAAFQTLGGPMDGSSFLDDSGLSLHLIGSGPNWAAPISDFIAIGSKIVKLEYLVDRNTITTVTFSLLSMTFSLTPTPATEHTIATSAGGLQIVDSGAIAITLDVGKIYVIEVDKGSTGGQTGKFYGVRVTLG